MSTAVVSTDSVDQAIAEFHSGTLAVGVPRKSEATDVERVRSLASDPIPNDRSRRNELRGFIVKRRLKGFVTDTQGETWRVTFVENRREIPYDLPAENLRKAGIETRYQPFEMDELESIRPDISGKVYRFRPLAETKDAFLDTLPLDPDRQSKRDLILAYFRKSQA
jgi:hypothetical protein